MQAGCLLQLFTHLVSNCAQRSSSSCVCADLQTGWVLILSSEWLFGWAVGGKNQPTLDNSSEIECLRLRKSGNSDTSYLCALCCSGNFPLCLNNFLLSISRDLLSPWQVLVKIFNGIHFNARKVNWLLIWALQTSLVHINVLLEFFWYFTLNNFYELCDLRVDCEVLSDNLFSIQCDP